jgi:hypothetical protein
MRHVKYLDSRVRFIHGQIAKRVLDIRAVQSALNDKVAAIKRATIVETSLDAFSNILDRHGRGIGSQTHGHVAQSGVDDQRHVESSRTICVSDGESQRTAAKPEFKIQFESHPHEIPPRTQHQWGLDLLQTCLAASH